MTDLHLHSQIILTKDQLAAIGCVAEESAHCERVAECLIWSLAGLDPAKGALFTSGASLEKRFDLLCSLGKQHFTDDEKRAVFVSLVDDLKRANVDRNIIIHGQWDASIDTLLLLRDGPGAHPPAKATKRRRQNSQPATLSADKIQETAEKIFRLTNRLIEMLVPELPP